MASKKKEAPDTIPNPIALTKKTKIRKELIYQGMRLPKKVRDRISETTEPVSTMAIATAGGRQVTSVELNRTPQFVNFTQPPYTDGDLGRMEAATRRNLAVRAAITVREHFAFGRPSKLVIELNESDKIDKDEEQQSKEIERLTKENLEILKKITDLDEKVNLVTVAKGPFYWQNIMFGRGVIVKIYMNDETDPTVKDFSRIKKLVPINTRRLGLNIMDEQNDMEFEGVYIDGYAMDRLSLIYGTYQDNQISPYTEHYGYSALEPIMYIAQAHNVATEEDIPEILKSAWLKAILFVVQTAGLSSTEATQQIQTIIDAIDPGKYVGVNTDVKEAIPLDLNPDYDGIMEMVDSLESKIFKTLHVPQFLVQSEDMANMATANKSASLFIDGIISHDQEWMSNILWKQWYEPLLRREMETSKEEKKTDDPQKDFESLPFKIKRIWDKPTVEEFTELADALSKLKGAGIWDIDQANKILQTPEVAKRVMKIQEDNKKKMEAQGLDPNNPEPKSPIGTPDNNQKTKTD